MKFKLFETDGAGSNQSLEGHAYRNFHENKCYELSIRIVYANPALFDSPFNKELSPKDWADVNAQLKGALDSFQFLK